MTLLNRHTLLLLAGAVFLLALPVMAVVGGEPYLLTLFSRILIYAIAAVSLDLLIGYSGMVSLGHAAFVGVGAYVVGILYQHGVDAEPLLSWPVVFSGSESGLLVWPLAVAVSAMLALVIGALSLRTSGMHFIMITLAFAQMLYYFFVSLAKYGGDDGLSMYSRNGFPVLDISSDVQFYYVCLACLAVFLYVCSRLVHSRFGLIIRGAKTNTRRMNSIGIPAYRYKLVCFVIAGGGAGLAGALLANQTEYVSPGLLHWTMSGELMVMVLLGGIGTLFGPVLGAAGFLLLEETLSIYTEHWMVYMGPLLILMVVFAKNGLYGLLTGNRDDAG